MQRLLYLVILVLLPLSSYGWITVIPEVKGGYFEPNGDDIREVYANNLAIYGLDVNLRLASGVWFWTGLGYWQKKGFDDGVDTKSRISAFPCTLGLKFTKCICQRLRMFGGVGARYTYLRIKNDFEFFDEHQARGGAGVAFTGGFHLLMEAGLYLMPFFEYSTSAVKFKQESFTVLNRSTDPGGWSFGIGIGFWPCY